MRLPRLPRVIGFDDGPFQRLPGAVVSVVGVEQALRRLPRAEQRLALLKRAGPLYHHEAFQG